MSAGQTSERWFYFAVGLAGVVLALALAVETESGSGQETGAVAGQLRVKKDGTIKSDASGVVAYLEGVPESARARLLTKPRIRQKNLAFEPRLSVVPKGATVEFPNDDKVFHNVFSLSRAARFDLGLYKSGESKSVTFSRPGVVDVYCNIHPEMVAKIKVLDTPYYATTGRDGSFRIEGVPPGTYPLVLWQPHGEEIRTQVTVGVGKTARIARELEEGAATTTHLRKDGTPYGRYK